MGDILLSLPSAVQAVLRMHAIRRWQVRARVMIYFEIFLCAYNHPWVTWCSNKKAETWHLLSFGLNWLEDKAVKCIDSSTLKIDKFSFILYFLQLYTNTKMALVGVHVQFTIDIGWLLEILYCIDIKEDKLSLLCAEEFYISWCQHVYCSMMKMNKTQYLS